MKRTLLAAVIAIAATLVGRAQEAPETVQVVEARLADLGGDWELRNVAESFDLTATGQGKVLTYEWMDETGLADAEIELVIHWRHHRGYPCSVSLNGVHIGPLDQPQETLIAQPNVFYPTIHLLRIHAGAYAAFGLNRFELMTNDSREGASVGVCEPPGMEVALRFTIRAARREVRDDEIKPMPVAPVIPQAVILVDVSAGIILQPGMVAVSFNVQIMAILADANGGTVRLQIEVRVGGAPFIGVPTTESAPVASGGAAAMDLPAFDSGESRMQVRTVDKEGLASDWVPVDAVFEAQGGSTLVRFAPQPAQLTSGQGSGAAGSDGDSSGSCSAGATPGAGAIAMMLAALVLIGALRGRIR